MISESFLAILACPETKQRLSLASEDMKIKVRSLIDGGSLSNIGGNKVEGPISDLLVREYGNLFYIVRDGIPILLVEEGVLMAGIEL